MSNPSRADDPTLSAAEIAQFSALAGQWWDPRGPMRPLHAMNPCRIGWITDGIAAHFGADAKPAILDLGCGAGLAAEALAVAGFPVLGVDAAEAAIAAGRAHGAAVPGLVYRVGRAEDLVADGLRFPVVTALEVIEHVPDPGAFLVLLAELLAPGGLLFVSTLNRTKRAWLTAKFGAEYVLRLLPAGTHDWRQFVPPADLARYGRAAGLHLADATGMVMSPTGWRTGPDLSVNYIARLASLAERG
jgi:2-polyprenyl-6-hydroxyphenyl methylase/3-demethylubiquinone-9 3-methyltransferase